MVLALLVEPLGICSRYVTEPNAARKAAKGGTPSPMRTTHVDDNIESSPRIQAPFDRDPTVNVEVVGAAPSGVLPMRRNPPSVRQRLRHGQVDPGDCSTPLSACHRPGPERQNRLEDLQTYHDHDTCIDSS